MTDFPYFFLPVAFGWYFCVKSNKELVSDTTRRVIQDSCFREFEILEKCFGLKYFGCKSLFLELLLWEI